MLLVSLVMIEVFFLNILAFEELRKNPRRYIEEINGFSIDRTLLALLLLLSPLASIHS